MLKCSFKRDGAVSLCPFQDIDTSVGVSCTGQFVLIGRDEGIQILLPPLFANCFVTKIDARVNAFARQKKESAEYLTEDSLIMLSVV